MSAAVVNKCFGVPIRIGVQRSVSGFTENMLRELARLNDPDDDEDNPFPEFDKDCADDAGLEWAEEVLGDLSYGLSVYTGSDPEILAIGFQIESWLAFELEGEEGLIKGAQPDSDEELASMRAKWDGSIKDEVKSILARYGQEPRVFWCGSFS